MIPFHYSLEAFTINSLKAWVNSVGNLSRDGYLKILPNDMDRLIAVVAIAIENHGKAVHRRTWNNAEPWLNHKSTCGCYSGMDCTCGLSEARPSPPWLMF
jgi:hypothetical protein